MFVIDLQQQQHAVRTAVFMLPGGNTQQIFIESCAVGDFYFSSLFRIVFSSTKSEQVTTKPISTTSGWPAAADREPTQVWLQKLRVTLVNLQSRIETALVRRVQSATNHFT